MTPPAATVAARQRNRAVTAGRPRANQSVRARTATAPRTRNVRRVSGPSGGISSSRNSAVIQPPAVLRPRINTGGKTRTGVPAPRVKTPRVKRQPKTLKNRFSRVRSRIGLIEQLLKGRVLIPLVGVCLIGIVAMQVSTLKMNAGIGRAVERETALTQSNTELRAQISRLSSPERIRLSAEALGMTLPGAGSIKYLTVRPNSDPTRASRAIANGSLKPTPVNQISPTPAAAVTPTSPVTPPSSTPQPVPPASPVSLQSSPTQVQAAPTGSQTAGVTP